MNKININIQDICKLYYNQSIILDYISINVQRGEVVAIMLPSGCGKSTLLHLLCMLLC